MFRPHYQHNHSQHMYDICKAHIHRFVVADLTDGSRVNGVITDVDNQHVYMAVPNVRAEQSDERFWFGYPGYGYPYGYPPYYGPSGAFRRLVLPLTALVALSALPWY